MSLLRQLIDAIAHAHSRGIVYRDLKPANVMISDRKPRVLTLIDFGRATHLERAQRLENQPPLGTSLFQVSPVTSSDPSTVAVAMPNVQYVPSSM